MNYKNIYLIGMPGCGKSYWGGQLAAAYKLYFADLDREIERIAGSTIPELFAREGETGFRKRESASLEAVIAAYPANAIIACGGGTPCFGNNMALMQQSGRVVYLQADLDWLEHNILRSNELRPLLDNMNLQRRLQELLATRRSFYEQADETIAAGKAALADFAPVFERAAL